MQNITKPARIVDLHTHLFNARCMPMAGIIANLFGRDAKSSLFARVSADLINKLTQSEDEPDLAFGGSSLKDGDEGDYADRVVMITLERLGLVRTDVAFVAGPIGRPSLTQLTAAELAVIASSEIVELVRAVESAITELESEIGGSAENGRLADSMSIAESFDSGDQLAVTKSIRKVILNQLRRCEAKVRSLAHEIGDFSQFCFSMLTSINTQYSTLKKRYGNIEPKLMLVHHMMDMENAYVVNGTSRKEIRLKYDYPTQQTAILSDLGKKNNDKLIGFAAFDPRRSDWEDIANRAIDEQGFTGFKFYPAMGYLPIGTTNIDRTDTVPQSIVAQRVKDFFFWCVKNDKPVFTHCTPIGFETRFKEGLNTSPKYWKALLDSNNKLLYDLRLCFGHGGGGHASRTQSSEKGKPEKKVCYEGWTASDADWKTGNFAFDVVAMCIEYPNVYCELAYITDVFEGTKENCKEKLDALERNLLNAVSMSIAAEKKFNFTKKIAYGSDWNMPSMVRHPRKYLDVFLDLFERNTELGKFREGFFSENALSFLKSPNPTAS